MNAVITAGGVVDGEFARAIATSVKALAPLRGTTLLDLAVDAARGAGARGVAVVGGPAVRAHCRGKVEHLIDASEDGSENVRRALGAWPAEPLVYLTSDLPFVDSGAVAAFVARSAGYALTMPLASSQAYEARFPGAPEHIVTLGGERVANGNVFFIAPEARAPLLHFAGRFFEARKSKLRMAVLLGVPLLVRFALRRLTIEAIERKAQRTLGVPVAAIRDADPGICYDVDTLAEYCYARDRT
ncbi:MAG: NTP transferase domain-containing protein [Candidatus Eremiobacteraeota bacterium]|nr:NTP transferase domain-containing protein [Candidatus Eremiobacteraeota bacterium]